MLVTVLVFIIILGVLVFVHELGHFVIAKRNGIGVEEFGFGFPPRAVGIQFMQEEECEKVSEEDITKIKSIDAKAGEEKEVIKENVTEKIYKTDKLFPVKKWRIIWGNSYGDDENEKQDLHEAHEKNFSGGTIYSLNWLPIGGFVRIKGEDGEGKKEEDSFASKSAWIRVKVLAAGVIMNFILAWVLLSATFMLGSYQDVTGQHIKGSKIFIEGIEKDSPAEKMGLRIGDIIVGSGDGIVFSSVEEVQQYINERKGKEIRLIIQREKKDLALSGTPREKVLPNQGALGISGFGEVIIVRYPFFESLWKGLKEVGNMFLEIGRVFSRLIHGDKSGIEIMGPVKLAMFTGQIIPLGFVFILRFIAIFSINLGIINVLPFPALDGGRILFIIIEKIKGSPVSQRVEQGFHTVGMMLLLALMAFIFVREILELGVVDKIKGII